MESGLNRRRLFGLIAAVPVAAALPVVATPSVVRDYGFAVGDVSHLAVVDAAQPLTITVHQWDDQFFTCWASEVAALDHPNMCLDGAR